MDGCLRQRRWEIERDTALSWRVGKFNALASIGKLKGLQHYLDELKPRHETSPVLEAVATFTTLAKRGLVTIRERAKKGGGDGE